MHIGALPALSTVFLLTTKYRRVRHYAIRLVSDKTLVDDPQIWTNDECQALLDSCSKSASNGALIGHGGKSQDVCYQSTALDMEAIDRYG